MNARFGLAAPAALLALSLGGCASDRVASTEVENELTAVVIGSAEDTIVLVAARWTLSDSTGVIAAGTTDSVGEFTATIPWSGSELVFALSGSGSTLSAVVPAGSFGPGDTLHAGINLFTDAVARAWKSDRSAGSFARLGDSLSRGITGFPLPYQTLSKPRSHRSREAAAVLDAMSLRAGASHRPPGAFLDSLARDPSGSLLRDTSFSRDLADAMRAQGLPPDSQTFLVRHLDSLGGQDGDLEKAFAHEVEQADTNLLTGLLPWLDRVENDGFRQPLLARAAANATAVLRQPRPAFDPRQIDELVRRLSLRTTALALDGLDSPPDSAGRTALSLLLAETDSVVRETFLVLRIENWFGRDDHLAEFLVPILLDRRRADWSVAEFVAAGDPAGYQAARWPLPHGQPLRQAIQTRAASGVWGAPSNLLVPDSSSTGK